PGPSRPRRRGSTIPRRSRRSRRERCTAWTSTAPPCRTEASRRSSCASWRGSCFRSRASTSRSSTSGSGGSRGRTGERRCPSGSRAPARADPRGRRGGARARRSGRRPRTRARRPGSSRMRVVSLACSNTEIVHALGCAHRLVGVDDHSDFPEPTLAGLPRLGPDLAPDLDRVEALRPDLVLASLTVPGHERVVEALARRGLPFVAPEPISLEHVYRDVALIARLLGVPERGDAVIARMRAELDAPAPP